MRTDLEAGNEKGRILEIAGVAFILAVFLYIYRGAFRGFFVQDDFGWLFESRFQTFWDYLHSFFRFNNARSYRPLSQETFFLVFQKIFGLRPFAFHGMSVACHLIATILAYRLLRKFASPIPSLAGTLFFAVHTAHFRSIYWIAAVPEPMALVFYLLAVLCFVQFDRSGKKLFYCWSVGAMGLGMLSKESILTVPLVLAAYALLFARNRLLWTAPHFAFAATYGLLRALSRSAVDTAPYKLTFGSEAWNNLLAYSSWTAGFSETLLAVKLKWSIPAAYPYVAAGFLLAVVLMVSLARDRRVAVFALLWFSLALQPVLYFQHHIFGYYLAPALPAVALLIAIALDGLPQARAWKGRVLATAVVGFSLWSSYASVKREGPWWNERSFIARDILSRMPDVVRQVPPGRVALLFGLGETEFGAMQNDAALKAFGISPYRHILVGLDDRTPEQIETLRRNGGIRELSCFLYSSGAFMNCSEAFWNNPKQFVLIQPLDALDGLARSSSKNSPVQMEVNSNMIRAGTDFLTIRVRGMDAAAIDVLYTLDGRLMPAVTRWPLDENRSATTRVDASTPHGDYHYRAIRNSADTDIRRWHPLDVHVRVH